MKKKRLAKIIELIKNLKIETQEELQAYLKESGFDVTQATISRDIKELRLVKELSDEGRYVYSLGVRDTHPGTDLGKNGIINDSVLSIDYAVNTVCIKCRAGTAGAVCAAVDSASWSGVLGTIAGDDTILLSLGKKRVIKTVNLFLNPVINNFLPFLDAL